MLSKAVNNDVILRNLKFLIEKHKQVKKSNQIKKIDEEVYKLYGLMPPSVAEAMAGQGGN